MIVVDASALLELLLRTHAASRVSARLFGPEEILVAPHLLDVEIAQVLRRYAAAGNLDEARAEEALQDLADMPIARYPHVALLPRIWELRHNMTAYDAAYVALAEALQGSLLTREEDLAHAPGHRAVIELL